MRVRLVPMRGLRGFGAFGSTSPFTQADCPVGGDWDRWCYCMFPTDSDAPMNARCRSRPFPLGLISAPWTEVGAAARGMPKPGSVVASVTGAVLNLASGVTGGVIQSPAGVVGSASTAVVAQGGQAVNIVAPAAPPEEPGLFGIPKTAAFVGLGVLGLGLAAVVLTRRK